MTSDEGTLDQNLGGLFRLSTKSDGTVRAEFTQLTAPHELRLRLKLDDRDGELAVALLLLATLDGIQPPPDIPEPKIEMPFGGSNVFEVYQAAKRAEARFEVLDLPASKLRVAIGEDIVALASPDKTPEQKTKARKSLEKLFRNAFDALERKSERKSHGRSITIPWLLNDGTTQAMPLAWVVLQVARELVEKTRKLPTKGEVRRCVESRFEDAVGASESTWRNVWQGAGLQTLRGDGSWTLSPKERHKRIRGRNKKPPF